MWVVDSQILPSHFSFQGFSNMDFCALSLILSMERKYLHCGRESLQSAFLPDVHRVGGSRGSRAR